MQSSLFIHPKAMKYMLILLAGLLCRTQTYAQKKGSPTLYGYKQAVAAGTRTEGLDENNKTTEDKAKSTYNYYLYLSFPPDERLYPVTIWIEGKAFDVQGNMVKDQPIIYTSYQAPDFPQKIVLVPQTGQMVMQLIPSPLHILKSKKGEKLAQTNALVLTYKKKGNLYNVSLKHLKQLEREDMQ